MYFFELNWYNTSERLFTVLMPCSKMQRDFTLQRPICTHLFHCDFCLSSLLLKMTQPQTKQDATKTSATHLRTLNISEIRIDLIQNCTEIHNKHLNLALLVNFWRKTEPLRWLFSCIAFEFPDAEDALLSHGICYQTGDWCM